MRLRARWARADAALRAREEKRARSLNAAVRARDRVLGPARAAPRAPPARAAPRLVAPERAPGSSAACPEIRRGQPTLAGSDHDQPTRRRPTRTDRTGACELTAKRGRPSTRSAPLGQKSQQPIPRAQRRVLNRRLELGLAAEDAIVEHQHFVAAGAAVEFVIVGTGDGDKLSMDTGSAELGGQHLVGLQEVIVAAGQ